MAICTFASLCACSGMAGPGLPGTPEDMGGSDAAARAGDAGALSGDVSTSGSRTDAGEFSWADGGDGPPSSDDRDGGLPGLTGRDAGRDSGSGSSEDSGQDAATAPTGSYRVSVQLGTGGSVSPAEAVVPAGETAMFTVNPDSGFAIDSVHGCGGSLSGGSYTTAPITEACSVIANFVVSTAAAADVTVTRNAQQTMMGIEGNAAIGEGECDATGLANARDELARRAVEDFGLDRVRLEVRAGSEAPGDWWTQYLDGVIDRPTWKQRFYDEINDNSDPMVADPAGFHFSEVDTKIELVVEPLRKALAKHGRELYVSLNYVDFAANGLHRDNPDEYAEFMLEAYRHIERTYGWVPDAIEVLLEPDKAGWNGPQFGANLAALQARMQAEGYSPEYIGPSVMEMHSTRYYVEAAFAAAGPNALDEISYHKYGAPVTAQDYADVRALMTQYGVRSGMLEKLHETHLTFERDLVDANASTWQQLGIAHCGADNGGDYFVLELANPAEPVISIGQNTRYVAQYSRTVYRGAVRYDANGSGGGLTPFAFQHADGKWTVVVRADGGGSFTVGGLPSATYGVFHTTASDYLHAQADVQTDSDGLLTLQIPAGGVITAYQK